MFVPQQHAFVKFVFTRLLPEYVCFIVAGFDNVQCRWLRAEVSAFGLPWSAGFPCRSVTGA